MSLSARRAWIEIKKIGACFALPEVALRKESVDRNVRPPAGPHVAHEVALRKESVDRNLGIDYYKIREHRSLSARRAWIEILLHFRFFGFVEWSLSARRAWIEITK